MDKPAHIFITIYTHNRRNLLHQGVGATLRGRPAESSCAQDMIEKWLLELENKYPGVKIDKFVIMPNHVHMILFLEGEHSGAPLPVIVTWFKTMTTNAYLNGIKQGIYLPYDNHLWQRGYYEHIIRNSDDYLKVWQYIDNNPAKWSEDEYYLP